MTITPPSPAPKRYGFPAWIGLGVLFLLLVTALPPHAQENRNGGDQPTFIRDAEIESYLHALAAPIYRAADINPDDITIAIVESNTVNAFVAGGMNEFFYTGLLQLADSPEQLIGVMAHETGHIAGGHLIRGKEEMRNASAEAILGAVLALGAGIASGNAQAAAGALSGSQNIAERSFLSFNRSQEASADAAGLSFLDKAGVTSGGMLEFFNKLAAQETLPVDRQAEFVRTHPLTQNRIDAVRDHLEHSTFKGAKLDPKFYVMHERMKAKLLGYIQPETALLRYTDHDPRLTARYARAIALYRTSQADHALTLVDGLIHEKPDDPFFYELKGQILFENGRVPESLLAYKKANELFPDSALLHEAYGHALLEARDRDHLDDAIDQLMEATHYENHLPLTWHMLAAAWGQKAEQTKTKAYEGLASYALAEEAVANGNDKEAAQLADRAMKNLAKGTPYWLRAQDIKLTTAPEEPQNDKKKDKDKKKLKGEKT